MSDYKEIARILIIIGAIVAVIEGILSLVGGGIFGFIPFGGIVVIILGVLLLMMVFQGKPLEWDNAIIILIFGILLIIFSGLISGILVIIAAILLFLD